MKKKIGKDCVKVSTQSKKCVCGRRVRMPKEYTVYPNNYGYRVGAGYTLELDNGLMVRNQTVMSIYVCPDFEAVKA